VSRRALRGLAAAAALALLSGCAGLYFHDAGPAPVPPPRYSLAELPQKEYWTGIVFNGAKVGFSHTRVAQTAQPDRFEIASEAVMHFRFLGYDKRVEMRARDEVDADARLLAFDYEYLIDENVQHLAGEVRGDRLRYRLSVAAGRPEEKEEALSEPLFPAGALDLLPVLHGLQTGRQYRWLVFDGETRQISEARQTIEGYQRSDVFEGTAFKVTTEMLGVSGTTWIDARGRPVFALASHGVIISALEDEVRAKRYLAAAALNKTDVLVNWSLVKARLPLADPRAATYLRIEFTEKPRNREPPSDERQRCRPEASVIVCEIDARTGASSQEEAARALLPSSVVQSRDPFIRLLGLQITADRETTSQKIDALLAWIEQNIRKEPVDSFSALEVLRAKSGECQGHSYLYAAFARSLGVPTRLVNGLAYSADHGGFLYHTWTESFVDGAWRAVDPTFAQSRADATHIALVRGENMVDLVPLVDWVGNTRIRVLEAR